MAEEAANVENYDESMLKCKKISKLIPGVCENIKQLQSIDKQFDFDFNLKLAEQLLASLDNMEYPSNSEDKVNYVNEYRDHLTTGLRSLGSFFNTVTGLELLRDEQRGKISAISANIFISQDSIMKIASS